MKFFCYLLLAGICTAFNSAIAEKSSVIAGQLTFQVKMVQNSCSVSFSGSLQKDVALQLSHCPTAPYKVDVIPDRDSQNMWQLSSQKLTNAVNIYTVVYHGSISAEELSMPVSGILVTYY
jgi:hypothetical protein